MKRLYRSRKNKVLAGVCGGIAEYFNIDPVLVRVITVLLFFTGGISLLAYIIAIFVIPEEPLAAPASAAAPTWQPDAAGSVHGQQLSRAGALIAGLILVVFGAVFLMRNIPTMENFYWWFWDHAWQFFWPGILIVIGLVIIFRGSRK